MPTPHISETVSTGETSAVLGHSVVPAGPVHPASGIGNDLEKC